MQAIRLSCCVVVAPGYETTDATIASAFAARRSNISGEAILPGSALLLDRYTRRPSWQGGFEFCESESRQRIERAG